jgi:hypothetical protein
VSVRQLMEAEATRLTPGGEDLWPRVQAGLAAERRRARQRRLVTTSACAALALFGWLGVAPVGGWLPGAPGTVVPTAQAAEAAQPAGATPVPVVLTGVPAAPTPTATTTTTPQPGR